MQKFKVMIRSTADRYMVVLTADDADNASREALRRVRYNLIDGPMWVESIARRTIVGTWADCHN